MKLNPILLSVAAGLAVLTASPVRADDKPVTIAATYKAGDTEAYKVELHLTIAQMEIAVTTTSKATIKEVKPNGDIVAEVKAEKTVVTQNGTDTASPPLPPATITHDKLGKLLDVKMEASEQTPFTPEVARYVELINSLILPEKAVVTNDKWENEVDNPIIKGKKVTIKDTYLGIDKVDSADMWKVEQTIAAVIDDAGTKSTVDMTYWLDPTNGHVVKAEGKVAGIPTTFGANVDWTTKRSPVKPEKTAQ